MPNCDFLVFAAKSIGRTAQRQTSMPWPIEKFVGSVLNKWLFRRWDKSISVVLRSANAQSATVPACSTDPIGWRTLVAWYRRLAVIERCLNTWADRADMIWGRLATVENCGMVRFYSICSAPLANWLWYSARNGDIYSEERSFDDQDCNRWNWCHAHEPLAHGRRVWSTAKHLVTSTHSRCLHRRVAQSYRMHCIRIWVASFSMLRLERQRMHCVDWKMIVTKWRCHCLYTCTFLREAKRQNLMIWPTISRWPWTHP